MRNQLTTTVLALLLFLGGCERPSATSPVQQPGATRRMVGNQLPVWVELTPFEIQTIRTVRQATTSDNLLRLALIMGGEVRTEEQARPYLDTFGGFLHRATRLLAEEKEPWNKGFVLFKELYGTFLGGGENEPELSNYDLNQTRVDVLLTTRSYNCISSAVLFAIAADAVGLKAEGVLLPRHAFVQLGLPGSDKTIEVETTSPTGYDWIHDQSFYSQRAEAWARRRGLGPVSYQDYLDRRVVSVLDMVVHLYNVQHTRRGQLAEQDRERLIEIAGLLDESEAVQRARLGVWTRYYNDLRKGDRQDQCGLLFDRIASELAWLLDRYGSTPGIRESLCWSYINWAITDSMLNKTEAALEHAGLALDLLENSDEDYSRITGNLKFVSWQLAETLVDAERFDEAEKVVTSAERLIPDPGERDEFRGYIFGSIGNHFFEKEDWSATIAAFSRCKDVITSGERPCLHNLEAAFLNWSVEFSSEGDWPKAAAVLQRCLETEPGLTRCRTRLEQIRAQHRGAG